MNNTSLRFETLDSLRGFASIAVAIYHFYGNWAGYLAVDFFFVLSGFILSHNYLYKKKISAITFISHRLARLYPLHIFTLFTFIIVWIYINKDFPRYVDGTFFTFLQQLTLTQNIGFNPNGLTYNAPSWSISVEFFVNIIFFIFITKSTKNSMLLLVVFFSFLVIYNNTGHLDVYSENYFKFMNSGMIRGISSFFLGVLSYRIYLFYKNGISFKKNINIWEILCIIGVLVIVFGRTTKFSGIDFFAPFIFMFVVIIFSLEFGYFSRFLKKLKYLGVISYSIYLNQITMLLLIRHILEQDNISKALELFVYLSSVIIYSHFTYKYIEKPLRKKGKNLLSCITSARTDKQ